MSSSLQTVLMSKWTEKELSRSATPGKILTTKTAPHFQWRSNTRQYFQHCSSANCTRSSSDQSSDHESLHSAGNSELESNATEQSTGSLDSDSAFEDGPPPGNEGTGSCSRNDRNDDPPPPRGCHNSTR